MTSEFIFPGIQGSTTIVAAAVAAGAIGVPVDLHSVIESSSTRLEVEIPQRAEPDSVEIPLVTLDVVIETGARGPRGPSADEQFASPAFTYEDGAVTRVDYADGSVKLLSYDTEGRLSTVDLTSGGVTTRQTYTYNPDGTLAARSDTVI